MMRPAQFGEAPSRRETQVAIALLFDRSSKQIARELGIAPQTVNGCLHRLYRKYGVHGAEQLVEVLMVGPIVNGEKDVS